MQIRVTEIPGEPVRAGTTCAIAERLVACGRAPTPQHLSARGQHAFRARVDQSLAVTVTIVAGRSSSTDPATVAAAPIESAIASTSPPTSAYASSGSFRLADTRSTDCGCTMLDATTMRVDVAGRFGIADDITAAVVTVTATNITADTFLTAYPAGQAVPNTSIVNPRRNHDVGNTAIVPVGVDGAIDIRSTIAIGPAIDVVVDVTGFFVPAASATQGRFVPATPERILDTRRPGSPTGRLAPGGSVDVPRPAGVPARLARARPERHQRRGDRGRFPEHQPDERDRHPDVVHEPRRQRRSAGGVRDRAALGRRVDDPRHRREATSSSTSSGGSPVRQPGRAPTACSCRSRPPAVSTPATIRATSARSGRSRSGWRVWCRPAPPRSRPT